jgi:hypothetical protein
VGTTKTEATSNGLLEIHHELLELRLQEDNFKGQLQRVAEERRALEQRLAAWPAEKPPQQHPPAETPPQHHHRKPKRKPARSGRPSGRGAAVDVLGVLRENRGEVVSVQDIRGKLPGTAVGSIHQALSVLKKKGHAKNPGLGKWTYAAG